VARVLPAARVCLSAAVVLGSAWYGQQMLTDRFSARQNDSNQSGLGIAAHRFPVETAETLARIAPAGRVFGTLLENAYLVSRGVRVFADPRLEVYGEPIFVEFLEAQVDPEAFRAAAARHDVRAALVDLEAPIAAALLGMPGWRLVAFDTVAALFLREDAAPDVPAIAGAAAFASAIAAVRADLAPPRPWASTGPFRRVSLPGPYLALADFLVAAGRSAEARVFLDEAAAASPFARGIHRRRARLLEQQGDARGVVEAATAALAEDPGDHRTMARLGEAWYRLGDPAQAERWLAASLAGLDDRALTWSTLGRIRLAAGDLEAAESALARAVALAPADATYRANLARVAGLRGRNDEAIAGLEAALALDPSNASIYRDLIELHGRAGRVDVARELLERGLRVAPDDPELRRLHEALTGRGR
jgi:tetratricopeptide (TPR) repeat protein